MTETIDRKFIENYIETNAPDAKDCFCSYDIDDLLYGYDGEELIDQLNCMIEKYRKP